MRRWRTAREGVFTMYRNGRFFYTSSCKRSRYKKRRRPYSKLHTGSAYWPGEKYRLIRRRHSASLGYDDVSGQDYVNVRFR